MDDFERRLETLSDLGFSRDYCDRLLVEHKKNPDSIELYVKAVCAVYDDRKEYVD